MHCRTPSDFPAQIHQCDQELSLHTIQHRASAQTLHKVVTLQLPLFLPGPQAALRPSKSHQDHPHAPQNRNSQTPASGSLSQDVSINNPL